MKGRFRVLKTGIRLHGIEVTDCIWHTCCALHNFFLQKDGLNEEWVNGESICTTAEYSNHNENDVNNHAPRFITNNVANMETMDLTGMGPGDDNTWPIEHDVYDNDGYVLEQFDTDNDIIYDETIENDVLDLAQEVNKLTLNEFRKRLIENHDILFESQQLKWPSRLHQQRPINYNSRIFLNEE
jgi:hypothetical protein